MNYFLLYISAFIEPIFYRLIYMSIIASVIGLIIFGITRIFKNKISPKWVSRIWLIFIISLIIPIQFKSVFSIYNFFEKDLDVAFNNVSIARDSYWLQGQLIGIDKIFNTYLNGELHAEKITEQEAENISQNFEKTSQEYSKIYSAKKITNFLPTIWLSIIFTLVILYVVVYYNFITKLKRTAKEDERLNRLLDKNKSEMNIKRKIKIFYQDVIDMPSIFGLFKIKILINNDSSKLTDKELSYIIKHELAHYKRKDNWLNFLITILKCIYIFNPIVYFCLIKVKKDIELSADELAMKTNSDEERQEYLKTLVRLSENKPVKFLVQNLCLSDEKKNLEKRIDTLKLFNNFKKKSLQISIISIAFICILAVTCFTRNEAYMKPEDISNFVSNKQNNDFSNCYIKETRKLRDGTIDCIIENYIYGDKVKTITKYTEDDGVPTIKTNYYNVADKDFSIIEDEFGKKEIKNLFSEYHNDIADENNLLRNVHSYTGETYNYNGIKNVDGENCYVVQYKGFKYSTFDENLEYTINPPVNEFYISTNTGLIKKTVEEYKIMIYDYYTSSEYYYEFGNIEEKDFQIPDLSNYSDTTMDFYKEKIDFYDIKGQVLNNKENSQEALNDFSMLENLPDSDWKYSYSERYYLIDGKYIFYLNFNNYNNEEYYKLTVRQEDAKLLKLETGKLDENKNLIVSTTEY